MENAKRRALSGYNIYEGEKKSACSNNSSNKINMQNTGVNTPLSDISNVVSFNGKESQNSNTDTAITSEFVNGRRKRRLMCKENWSPMSQLCNTGSMVNDNTSNKIMSKEKGLSSIDNTYSEPSRKVLQSENIARMETTGFHPTRTTHVLPVKDDNLIEDDSNDENSSYSMSNEDEESDENSIISEDGHDLDMNIDEELLETLITKNDAVQYCSLGKPSEVCQHCDAIMWKEERMNKNVTKGKAKFSKCCVDGQIRLPKAKRTPPYLKSLYNDPIEGPLFQKNITIYNSMFSFTSMGGNVDRSINCGGGPIIYRLNGVNIHQLGSLVPKGENNPKFCQLYIYDTENEISNRMKWIDNAEKRGINPSIVQGLIKMFDDINVLVHKFRQARDRFKEDQFVELRIHMKASRSVSGRPNNISPSDEVAAVLVGDAKHTKGVRDIVVHSKSSGLIRIPEIHPLRAALQYPILFPNGEDGYHDKLQYVQIPGKQKNGKKRQKITPKEYYSHTFQVRKNQDYTMRLAGRLFQQFIVDSFSSIEQARLYWIKKHQEELRCDLYHNIRDRLKKGDGDSSNVGKSYILPSSFTGSKRYMQQNFQDALAICRVIGHPDLFLTMTCNTEWDEISHMMALLPGCRVENCPDIIARVFKLKVDQLCNDIQKKQIFGKCTALMYVVEYQKRGLPHIHMLIWLDKSAKPKTCESVDTLVCAEIPDPTEDPELYEAVKKFMIHGPCGKQNRKSPCMKDFKCTRHFPKKYCTSTTFDDSGFPIYRRRKTAHSVKVRKADLDNQWVVPYNRYLLLRYQCHINLEVCAHASSLKYLFKYCLKGHDQATVLINRKTMQKNGDGKEVVVDEIKTFLEGRYICGVEAAHRIYGFDVHYRTISVQRLPFHLPFEKSCTFHSTDKLASVERLWSMKKSKLEAYFQLNKVDKSARNHSYSEIPQFYVWNGHLSYWSVRKKGFQIGRLTYAHHSTGELWYLRMLLCKICGPTSYEDLLTVKGVLYKSFQSACDAHGWLANDKEWDEALSECSAVGFPNQVRELFVYIIQNCKVYDMSNLWNSHKLKMSEDILYNRRKLTGKKALLLSQKEIEGYALAGIDNILRSVGKCLKHFKQLPQPDESFLNCGNDNLIIEETSYNIEEELIKHQDMISKLNDKQMEVYNSIMDSVENRKGGLFFVYGSGGCGKTFLWCTIISKLRSQRQIVIPVASSGIAATLMPGGRTAHSRFKIPIVLDEDSSCNISHDSDIAQLLKKTDLIIWDEAPMQHRHAFEALDRTLRDIMKSVSLDRFVKPFGGITVLLGGDFRQILPVIPCATRSEVVSACITRSALWDNCTLFVLSSNMRVKIRKCKEKNEAVKRFTQWVLAIGDGKIGTCNGTEDKFDGLNVEIPKEFCLMSDVFSVEEIIDSTFPDLIKNYTDESYISQRAILSPTNEVIQHVNAVVLDKIPGECHSYHSIDNAEELGETDQEFNEAFSNEYLNSLNEPGLPPHNLTLKENVVVMLVRNLNQILGLCNGTRMIVRKCLKHCVLCEVISGNQKGTQHFIPRIEMSPSDSHLPFKLNRLQLPLQVCYAMTINKSQGQSLDRVGLYLPTCVFSHGQLYVAISRVTSPGGLSIYIQSAKGSTTNVTKNVVYEEIFYSLPTVTN